MALLYEELKSRGEAGTMEVVKKRLRRVKLFSVLNLVPPGSRQYPSEKIFHPLHRVPMAGRIDWKTASVPITWMRCGRAYREVFKIYPWSLKTVTAFPIFIRILLPMAGPALATLGIFCFMYNWNDYFSPLIYIVDERLFTLPLGLANMKGMYSTNWPVLMAASTISIIPVLIAFLSAQNAFVKGVALSGLKD
jgi:hypothetical protein